MIKNYLIIGLGGGLRAIARVSLGAVLPHFIGIFPLYILCINGLGCLAMGFLTEMMALSGSFSPSIKSFLTTGFLGGFTTFSVFALDFGLLFEKNQHLIAIFYALFSVLLSIVCFFTGLKGARLLF